MDLLTWLELCVYCLKTCENILSCLPSYEAWRLLLRCWIVGHTFYTETCVTCVGQDPPGVQLKKIIFCWLDTCWTPGHLWDMTGTPSGHLKMAWHLKNTTLLKIFQKISLFTSLFIFFELYVNRLEVKDSSSSYFGILKETKCFYYKMMPVSSFWSDLLSQGKCKA